MPGLDPKIRMAPSDEELIVFRTPKGVYCYKGATYLKAMQKILDDMLHKSVVRYQLKMNPLKCVFGVTSWKFLGFVVQRHGIKIEQAKIDAVVVMPEPRNLHELKSLQGKLAYLRRFISSLAEKCQAFSRLMKKGNPYVWDAACFAAFQDVKAYIMSPPVLATPIQGKPLIPYVEAQEQLVGALLAQENEEDKKNALYYLSRRMTPNELKYTPIEKLCFALIFSIQKLKQYFLAHTVKLISKANPIKYKAVKGQVLADFLADHPLTAEWELCDELSDEDVMNVEMMPPWKM
ncbi:hypothetical protein LIER_01870 [Lithospermum erythrorhizon]|uniref:Reverse transcriptase/retrotransposon-derived protein RNase H-like domain-containing protein n=1 Tax=Lithospermum erythrorhizon TaxID=34254 RepID=A0AAV3NMF9_LITER